MDLWKGAAKSRFASWFSTDVTVTDTHIISRLFHGLFWRRIALVDVAAIEAIEVKPWKWGGWGYRWIPFTRALAMVVRRGDGLLITLKSGSRFVVTVDDAKGALAVVLPLLQN